MSNLCVCVRVLVDGFVVTVFGNIGQEAGYSILNLHCQLPDDQMWTESVVECVFYSRIFGVCSSQCVARLPAVCFGLKMARTPNI